MVRKNRITPACAGKSRKICREAGCSRDHPRVCGEKAFSCFIITSLRGSPPRVRGKGKFLILAFKLFGITPACAGKRNCRAHLCQTPRDHPRVCGEKSSFPPSRLSRVGSPPRVRGKVLQSGVYQAAGGITPACAGKSAYPQSSPSQHRDHPRVCGEKMK